MISGRMVARALLLLVAGAVGAACAGPDAHEDSEALRADSSAAGYDVGSPGVPRASQRPAADSSARDIASARRRRTVPDTATRPPASATRRADSAVAVRTPEPARQPDRATTPRDTTRPILIARVRVNEYLEYEPVSRTAYIDIVATRVSTIDSSTMSSDTLAFNAGFSGPHTLTVPLGWRVVGQFVNRDPVHPHSAIVIPEVYPLPTVPPPAVFPQAFTRGVEDGLATNARDEMAFTADREGRFLIVCGVPGHAEAGQRMWLVVTPDVNVPAYRR